VFSTFAITFDILGSAASVIFCSEASMALSSFGNVCPTSQGIGNDINAPPVTGMTVSTGDNEGISEGTVLGNDDGSFEGDKVNVGAEDGLSDFVIEGTALGCADILGAKLGHSFS